MKYIGIDYGLKRTGLACTDSGGVLAYPLTTLALDQYKNRKLFLNALAERILGESPDAVIIGLPVLDDGTDSLTTRQVRNFAVRLAHRVNLPLFFMEEYLSSEEAWADLRDAGLQVKKRKKVLDQQAAVRILESFLHSPQGAIPVTNSVPQSQHGNRQEDAHVENDS